MSFRRVQFSSKLFPLNYITWKTHCIFRTTPIGVISLIAVSIASVEDVEKIFSQLGMFIAAITVGILIQQLVVLSAIFFAFTRKNPYAFLLSIAKPWMISFASTST